MIQEVCVLFIGLFFYSFQLKKIYICIYMYILEREEEKKIKEIICIIL